MINLIALVKGKEDFGNLKKNLPMLEPTWNIGMDFLCLVGDKDIYLEARDFLLQNIDRGECRIVYTGNESFKPAKEYLTDKNPYTFLWDCAYHFSNGAIDSIYRDFLLHLDTGFITMDTIKYGNRFYWVKDIYGYPDFIGTDEQLLEKGLVKIDIASPIGMMTKTRLFKEEFCDVDIEGAFDYSFGIKLRRQGYENYVDTNIRCIRR